MCERPRSIKNKPAEMSWFEALAHKEVSAVL